jgi:glycine betaine/choline ABC-type transport system substrate-binding protein
LLSPLLIDAWGNMAESVEGSMFGRYRLTDLIGRGGMGEVWRAFDTETQRVVAVKVLPAALGSDPAFEERFRREAFAAAGLTDPHIVPIHSFGEIDGRLYVDMRIVDGRDLAAVIDEGPMPPARAVHIVEQIAAALAAAHRIGLVHRDVKPSNILLADNDFAYLIDFGIARTAGQTRMTDTGGVVGTWAYLAPERVTSDRSDSRCDVYALACVLHECLTGTQPFPGDSLEQQLSAHLMTPPPHPSTARAGIPSGFDAVIERGMAKDPDERFATVTDLASAARAALDPAPEIRAAQTVVSRSVAPAGGRRRRSLLLAGAAAVVVVGVVLAAVLTLGGGTEKADGTAPVPGAQGSITIGSANFPESTTIAEIYAQALEANGFHVDRRFDIGDRKAYLATLTDHSVDLVPEYTGYLMQYLDENAAANDPAGVLAALKAALPQGLSILTPSPADDQDTVTVTAETAKRWNLTTIGDLAPHSAEVRFAGTPDFVERSDGLPGLRAAYGLDIAPANFVAIDDGGGPATVQALLDGTATAANIYSTSPAFQNNDLVILDDPEHDFRAAKVVPLVATDKVTDELAGVLNAVSAALTTSALSEMNAQTSGDNAIEPAAAARNWLEVHGFDKPVH